jgi:hypothetical protein
MTAGQAAPVLIDGPALAVELGVKPQTIRVWAMAGLLTRRGKDRRGRTLFDLDEAMSVSESGAAGIGALRSTPRCSSTRVPEGRP